MGIVIRSTNLSLLVTILAATPTWAQEAEAAVELPVIHERVVITATPLGPVIERPSAEAFRGTLFTRDDQVFHLLDAGIDAGQHEGGGKSIEVRRFGFNLDHGGVNGGLRVMVDNVPQNYGTQGHGQGYLGSLKSLSPELVDEVTLINGPFSAEYGDYSGLGVVHVLLRESLPDVFTARFQAGNHDSVRGFLAWSPNLRERDALVAYEGSYTNGPFERPLNYERHNVTGNYTWQLGDQARFGLKWNGGLNEYNSSGQLPLDVVAAGKLSPWGSLSPGDGGYVQMGRVGGYYRRELGASSLLKVDGFIERSLFDLYSNFTFYLNDPVLGDAIQQHDSRLSEGGNAQYQRPHVEDWGMGFFTAGVNFLGSHNNVDLRQRVDRAPVRLFTSAHANVYNGGAYVQERLELLNRKLELGGGLRFDVFSYSITDFLEPDYSGVTTSSEPQPKAFAAYTPSDRVPVKLFFNYGRGIASIDARGAVRNPDGPFINKLDFFQVGTSHQFHRRFSLMTDLFLIDSSNQVVYIPDDGTIEFAEPSRSYGFEVKTSAKLTSHLGFDGGATKVLNAYYKDTSPRVYVDSAPRFVANAALTLAGWKGWSGSLRMRAINHYRLDGLDPAIQAAGHTVFDFALKRRITRNVDLNFALDNMLDRDYWEMQNFFESRLRGQPPIERIHATPGYGMSWVVGLTVRVGGK
jgi:TonB-dependent receptor-like protein